MNTPVSRMGVLSTRGAYGVDALVAADPDVFGIARLPGHVQTAPPYQLPGVSSGPAIVISSSYLAGLRDVSAREELVALARRSFDRVWALDNADPFQLDLPSDLIESVDGVLKVNGLFRDPSLNEFLVGAPTAGGRWTEKSHPRVRYSAAALAKVHPFLPCFFGVSPAVRAATRRLYFPGRFSNQIKAGIDHGLPGALRAAPWSAARVTAHCVGALSHGQRLETLRRLRGSSLSWSGGLTAIPPVIAGWNGRDGLTHLTPQERSTLQDEIAREGFWLGPAARPRFLASMLRAKAVVAITGYGEISFRMAEAWTCGRVLVCQDLSHARTLYPFENGRNVIYCRPDLSDLADILDDIESSPGRFRSIAQQGRDDWRSWAQEAPGLPPAALRGVINLKH